MFSTRLDFGIKMLFFLGQSLLMNGIHLVNGFWVFELFLYENFSGCLQEIQSVLVFQHRIFFSDFVFLGYAVLVLGASC